MMTIAVRAFMALAFTATLFSTSSVAASAEETTTTTVAKAAATPALDAEVYERRIRYWINQKRINHGLDTLKLEGCTDAKAEKWSSFLANTLEFFHQDLGNLIDGCDAAYAGETLAKGPVGPRQMVRLWMESPGHRAIVLSTKPSRIGVGAYVDENGSWVVAANFTRF